MIVSARKELPRQAARRERENEKREKIGQQLLEALSELPAPSMDKIQTLVEDCWGALSFADDSGNLPLNYACACGAPLEVVRYLVEEYPESLQATGKNGFLPLHYACNCNCGSPLEIIRFLVQEYPESLQVVNKDGNLPLHHAGACGAPLEVVRYLVEEYPGSLEVTNNDGHLPLHEACTCKPPLEVVRFLVQEYPESLQVVNKDGNLPLHHAGACGAPLEVVRYLVQEYPKSLEVTNNDGYLPLHEACTCEAPLEVVRYLVQEYPKSLQVAGNYGNLPLHHACIIGAPLEVVSYLVQEYPDSLQVAGNDGKLPLHHACSHREPLDVVLYLVQEYPESLQVTSSSGKKPIDLVNNQEVKTWMEYAIAERREAIGQQLLKALRELPAPSLDNIKALVAACRGTLSLTDNSGNLPLHDACACGVPLEVLRYLVQVYPESIQVADNNGYLPLHYACNRGSPLEIVQFLVQEYPESLQVTANHGSLPLHNACYHDKAPLEIVRYLVQENPESLQATGNDESLPLHHACHDDAPLEIVSYLVQEYPESLQAIGDYGDLPLHACVHGSPLEVVQYLVEEYPQSLQVIDSCGYLPLHYACHGDARLEIIRYLVQEYPMSLQVTSSSGTEPIDMVKNHEVKTWMEYAMAGGVAFEGSTIYRSKESVADFKRIREEMKALMELTNQVMTESALRESENEKDSDKLSALISQFEEIKLLADGKRLSVEEKEERDAIRSSKDHCEFYVMFIQKMRCMVTACETLASGMVAGGGDQSLRMFAVQKVQEQSLAALMRDTQIGVFVAKGIRWSLDKFHFPFLYFVGSIIMMLATLKEERDKCIAVARVADFATTAALEEDADSVHRTIERTARYLIRSRRFVGTKEEFGPRCQVLLKLMAEPGCTQSKAEACRVADAALEILMKPAVDCPVRRIVERFDCNTRLGEALAAMILGSTVLDIQKLETFKAGHPSASGMPSSVGETNCTDGNGSRHPSASGMPSSIGETNCTDGNGSRHPSASGIPSSVDETNCTDINGSRRQQSSESTTLDTSAEVQNLENQVAKLSASHTTREEVQALQGNGSRRQQSSESTTLDTSAQVKALENQVAELSASHVTREEVQVLQGNGSRLQQSSESTTLDTSPEVKALENQVAELSASHATMQALRDQVAELLASAELSASHATQDEVQALHKSSRKLKTKFEQLEKSVSGKSSNSGSGSGLAMMTADFREEYKDKLNYIDGESIEHGNLIGSILKRMAILQEQAQQFEEVLRTHDPPSPQQTKKKQRSWNPFQKKIK